VRLNSLKLVNFRQHVDTRIEFESGLTGIIGPNGAGKTTILEAIAWALYGNQAVRGKRDAIRFTGASGSAPVEVELDFELGAHRYKVVRRLTTAMLYLDGGAEPIANSITAVTELLQRRLGMSLSEFFHTYFTGQKELSVMATMTPAKRGQFLSRVLGYERLRIAQELARGRKAQVKAAADGMMRGMPDSESIARALSEAAARKAEAVQRAEQAGHTHAIKHLEMKTVEPRWQMAQRQREQSRQLQTQIQVEEEKEVSLRRDAERIRSELESISRARLELKTLDELTGDLVALNFEMQSLDTLYSEDGRRRALVDSEQILRDEIARLDERNEKIERAPALEEEAIVELEAKRAELENLQGNLEAKRTAWVRDRQEADTKRQALRQQLAELKQQRERVVSLGEDGECPTCSRPLGGSLHTVVEHVDEMIESVSVDESYYDSRVEQLEQMPEPVKTLSEQQRAVTVDVGKLERRLAKVQLAVQELGTIGRELNAKKQRQAQLKSDISKIPPGYDEARHAEVRADIERLAPMEANAKLLRALVEREPQLIIEREQLAREIVRIQSTLGTLRTRKMQVSSAEADFDALGRTYELVRRDLEEAKVTGARAHEKLSSAVVALDGAEEAWRELKKKEEELAILVAERRIHDELDRAFSDLRTDLNFQLRPELSELASAFLNELTDARYSELELDDDYEIVILEDGIPKPVLSGGEEDLANLVLRLAISQMIAERAGQSFSLLILDEVFGSLDETRRFNVVELLRGLQDRFDQVILITHIESVREGLDQLITVRHDPESGRSIVIQGSDVPREDGAPVESDRADESADIAAAGAAA
jgi:exonuclease SbcC